jgi:hypothetical protein
MFNENTQPEGEGMNPTDVDETSIEDTESEDDEDGEQETPEVDYKLELERERKKAYELQQRLKKEKAKSKRSDLSSPDVPLQENAIQAQVLKAQGMSEDLINVLKTISEEQGVDLITAQKDDYFLFRKEKFEKELRDKEASLGASKGSGAGKARKDFSTPGLTPEEHRKMWKSAIGK